MNEKASTFSDYNFLSIFKALFDADTRAVSIKDENLKFIYINRIFAQMMDRTEADIIGATDRQIMDEATARECENTDRLVLTNKSSVVFERERAHHVYQITKVPVEMQQDVYGVGASWEDVTSLRKFEQNKNKELQIYKVLNDIFTKNFPSRQEVLDYILVSLRQLTESKYGFIFLYDEDLRIFTMKSWSRGVMDDCDITDGVIRHELSGAGLWGDAVREGRPIIVNEFVSENRLKNRFPKGHTRLNNFAAVPVVIEGRTVAVVGLANKPQGFDEDDVSQIALVMSGAWNAVGKIQAQEKLSVERNRYLQTLVSIGDGVLVVDKNGRIEMLNYKAEELTGRQSSEAVGRHFKEVFQLSDATAEELVGKAFAEKTAQKLGFVKLINTKLKTQAYIEAIAAPIVEAQTVTGAVLVFRDVSNTVRQMENIEYIGYHDYLTGLYNRHFYDEEVRRLDSEQNLPISVIMGDVNGLKLTNDIFGHKKGDELIKKAALALKSACRENDVVARVGGDEFVLLLPKTTTEQAERIMARVRSSLSKEFIAAIKCGMSLGCDTKTQTEQDLDRIVANAEKRMYSEKSLTRRAVNRDIINTIVAVYYSKSEREEQHSLNVSELSVQIGQEMNLPSLEIRKLKNAGFFHDIGKIALDKSVLLNKAEPSEEEWAEIRKHPVLGFRILNNFEDTMDLAEIVLAHHEHWDGTGFPKGLKGDEIPLLSRIINVAECYDQKLYGEYKNAPAGRDEVIAFIKSLASASFDPKVVEAFLRVMEAGY